MEMHTSNTFQDIKNKKSLFHMQGSAKTNLKDLRNVLEGEMWEKNITLQFWKLPFKKSLKNKNLNNWTRKTQPFYTLDH